jgi:hypothetical protein
MASTGLSVMAIMLASEGVRADMEPERRFYCQRIERNASRIGAFDRRSGKLAELVGGAGTQPLPVICENAAGLVKIIDCAGGRPRRW